MPAISTSSIGWMTPRFGFGRRTGLIGLRLPAPHRSQSGMSADSRSAIPASLISATRRSPRQLVRTAPVPDAIIPENWIAATAQTTAISTAARPSIS